MNRRVSFFVSAGLIFCATAFLLCGCRDSNGVSVKLREQQADGNMATVREVDAQVSGPLDGLRYKWFAVGGQCTPQESDAPSTLFRFAEGVRQDQVSVEIWRDGKRVATDSVKVAFKDRDLPPNSVAAGFPQVNFTEIPPAEQGGDKTHAYIRGTVQGKGSSNCFVVVYARSGGSWYIQPMAGSLHELHAGSEWDTWTHTGQKYAVLLVRRDFEPLDRLDMLPEVKGPILACAVTDGADSTQPVSSDQAKKSTFQISPP
jgi:hypothetical protein